MRKVKCDGESPRCRACTKSNKFCDWSKSIRFKPNLSPLSNESPIATAGAAAIYSPRAALQDPDTLLLFRHYMDSLAAWYDLNDPFNCFSTKVPQKALDDDLLFAAVLAFAGIHQSLVGAKRWRKRAEVFHARCVSGLLSIKDNDERIADGTLLAATCLLRSYEILAETGKPSTHLYGAYSIIISSPDAYFKTKLYASSFWNHLREDITYAFLNRCSPQLDVETRHIDFVAELEKDFANEVTLILAEILRAAFSDQPADRPRIEHLADKLTAWRSRLPDVFRPYVRMRQEEIFGNFPGVHFWGPYHIAGLQYFLMGVAVLLECSHDAILIARLTRLVHDFVLLDARVVVEKAECLETIAVHVCGMAFSSDVPAVLVNSFGPMSYAASWIRSDAYRSELIQRLQVAQKRTGWHNVPIINSIEHPEQPTPVSSHGHHERSSSDHIT